MMERGREANCGDEVKCAALIVRSRLLPAVAFLVCRAKGSCLGRVGRGTPDAPATDRKLFISALMF